MRLLWELSKYEYYQISSEVRAMQSIIHKISLPSPHPENFPPPPPPPSKFNNLLYKFPTLRAFTDNISTPSEKNSIPKI